MFLIGVYSFILENLIKQIFFSENDAQLRQSLTVFFNMFATNFPNASNMILDCFISTLNAFSRGGFREVVGKVDINDVANLMINLTRPSVNKYDTKVWM